MNNDKVNVNFSLKLKKRNNLLYHVTTNPLLGFPV